MAYTITPECINCEVCQWECCNGAISRGDEVHVIDRSRCTECADAAAPRCVAVCAVDCIHPEAGQPIAQPQ